MSEELAKGLRLTFYTGAIRKDATPEQLAEIQKEYGPLRAHYKATGDTAPLYALFDRVMGDWTPDAEWQAWIDGCGDVK